MTRIWSAVKLPSGHVVCEIQDVDELPRDAFEFSGDRVGWAALVHSEPGYPGPNDSRLDMKHTSKDCGSGRPCGQCHQTAQDWWPKAKARAEGLAIDASQGELF